MAVKKLTFCILCFANAANLATEEEDFNDENSSNSKVEENINKNNWNTRKWGSIYILLPGMHIGSIAGLFFPVIYLLLLSVEYKYIFPIKIGFSIRASLNPRFCICARNEGALPFSVNFFTPHLIFSFCWIYKKNGKRILSGSVSPIGFGLGIKIMFANMGKNDDEKIKHRVIEPCDSCKDCFFLNLTFLNYENGKGFYLSWGHFDIQYSQINLGVIGLSFIVSLLHLELGFDFTKITDRKKKNANL